MSRQSPSPTRTVGLVFDTSQYWLRNSVQGIAEHAAKNNWMLVYGHNSFEWHFEYANLQLDGVICDKSYAKSSRIPDSIPRVWIQQPNTPCVASGYFQAGRMCAEHLMERGYRQLAIFQTSNQSNPAPPLNVAGFKAAANEKGVQVEMFVSGDRMRNRRTWAPQDQLLDLGDFLKSLPMPIGVMGSDVKHTKRLNVACQHQGLSVPDQVGIVSPGDDPIAFAHTRPSISAVTHNQIEIGRKAAQLLDRLIQGQSIPDKTIVPPIGIEVRSSTDHRIFNDPLCRQVVEYLTDHLDQPIRLSDLADHFEVSERTLHRRFEQEFGRSCYEELLRLRIETAKRLLLTTNLPLVELALQCGYSSQSAFNRHFKQALNQTPLQLRQRHRGG